MIAATMKRQDKSVKCRSSRVFVAVGRRRGKNCNLIQLPHTMLRCDNAGHSLAHIRARHTYFRGESSCFRHVLQILSLLSIPQDSHTSHVLKGGGQMCCRKTRRCIIPGQGPFDPATQPCFVRLEFRCGSVQLRIMSVQHRNLARPCFVVPASSFRTTFLARCFLIRLCYSVGLTPCYRVV